MSARAIFGHGYALVVGVGADLPVTMEDATALADLLTRHDRSAYPPSQVQLLTGVQADRHGILSAFDRLIDQASEDTNSTVIIYFSGHGGQVAHPGGSIGHYLIPYGYAPDRRQDTAISGVEFTAKIEAIRARRLVVLLDCCHAGGIPDVKSSDETFTVSPVPAELFSVLETGSGKVIVASSRANEYSYTGTPYSVFTSCLLEALSGKAGISNDGYARILDVLIYLFKHVPVRTADRQHPFVKKVLDLGDNFPLCYYAGSGKNISEDVSNARPTASPANTESGKRSRLRRRLEVLDQEWTLRSEKIRRMRVAFAIETDTAIQFRLEQQLFNEELALAQLSDEMEKIEIILRQE